jgi:hypothetical protein
VGGKKGEHSHYVYLGRHWCRLGVSDAWALLEISLSWKEAGTGGREVT